MKMGSFKLKNITNGTYTIVISSVGFKSKYEKITFSGGENIVQNFSLNESNSLEEIVISGTLKTCYKIK